MPDEQTTLLERAPDDGGTAPGAEVAEETVVGDSAPSGEAGEEKPGKETPAGEAPAGEEKPPEKPEPPEEEIPFDRLQPGVQKRINTVTRKRREAERERDRLQLENERLRGGAPGTAPHPDVSGKDELPREEDFEDYAGYTRAVARHEGRIAAREEYEKARAAEKQTALEEQMNEKFAVGRKKYADFDEVALSAVIPYNDHMQNVVLESEHTAELAYFLGQHLEEAERIARLPPLAVMREVVKLEGKLSGKKTTGSKTTRAPAPIKPVAGGGPALTKEPGEMTPTEYRAWRQAGGGT